MPSTLKTLTVRELREVLEDLDPEARIIFGSDYGDYCRTHQALPLVGNIEEVLVEETAYSHSGFAVAKQEPDEDDTEDYHPFLLLS